MGKKGGVTFGKELKKKFLGKSMGGGDKHKGTLPPLAGEKKGGAQEWGRELQKSLGDMGWGGNLL